VEFVIDGMRDEKADKRTKERVPIRWAWIRFWLTSAKRDESFPRTRFPLLTLPVVIVLIQRGRQIL